MTTKLHGVIPAMASPRDNSRDDIDTACLVRLTHALLEAGVHGLFPTSSTGEAPLLTHAQRQAAIETVVEASGGRVPVLGGAGAASTGESVALARLARKAGATHLAVLPVHFVKVSPEELYVYFAAIADSVDIPTVLYNFPARTGGQNIPADVAARLAEKHNVVGIKDSGGDLTNTIGYIRACPKDFAVFVGAETLLYPALAMGGAGTICSGANLCPRQMVALYQAYRDGDFLRARAEQENLFPLDRALDIGTFPAPVKAALALLGQPVGDPFPPVFALSEEQRRQIAAELGSIRGLTLDKRGHSSL